MAKSIEYVKKKDGEETNIVLKVIAAFIVLGIGTGVVIGFLSAF